MRRIEAALNWARADHWLAQFEDPDVRPNIHAGWSNAADVWKRQKAALRRPRLGDAALRR